MIYQTDFTYNNSRDDNIQKYGCYFLSLVYGIQMYIQTHEMTTTTAESNITKDTIYELYNTLTSKEFMHKDCYIWKPSNVAQTIYEYLKGNKNKICIFSEKIDVNRYVAKNEIHIGMFRWKYSHFVLMGHKDYALLSTDYKKENVIYDPIYPQSNTVKNGYYKSGRIYKVLPTIPTGV